MLRQARRYLALEGLKDDRRLDEYRLSTEHRQRLKEWRKEAELQARLAITRAYRHLFYPVGETAESAYRPFGYQTLQIEEQGNAQTSPVQPRWRSGPYGNCKRSKAPMTLLWPPPW
jgi:hypothetical protein